MSPEAGNEVESPGWDAITEAVETVYPGIQPRHVGYVPGLHLGSGLQGCSAYRASDHWCYVTYGLTELWAKHPDADPRVSGWGYEMTLRLVASDRDEQAPGWPFNMLERIALHTQTEAKPLWVGDRLQLGGPITGEANTRLIAVAFTIDPLFPVIVTPNGRVEFRSLIGITAEELQRMQATSTESVLAEMALRNPLLTIDPDR